MNALRRIKSAFLAALGVLLLCAQPAFAQFDPAARGMVVNAKAATSKYAIAEKLLTAALRPQPSAAAVSVTVSNGTTTTAATTGAAYDGTAAQFQDPTYFQNLGAPYKTGNTGVANNNGGVGFGTDAPEIEFWMRGGKWEAWIDGVQASGSPFTSPGDGFKRLTFPDARQRALELRFASAVSNITGVTVKKPYSIWPTSPLPVVYVMGDSYTAAVGFGDLVSVHQGWAMRLGRLANWDTWAGGTGGSGWTAAPAFSTRITAIPTNADMIVFAGGINDSGAAPSTLTAAVSATVAAARARCPNALIVVLGPWRAPGQSPAQSISDAIKAGLTAVADDRMTFVDTYAENWQNGTGAGYSNLARSGPVTFTGALVAATSGTLTSGWVGATGSYTVTFDGGTSVGGINKTITLTNGSTAVTWTGAVTATANAWGFTANSGNSDVYFVNDLIHPSTLGHEYLAKRSYDSIVKWLRTIVAERGVVVGALDAPANDNWPADLALAA